ncbi:MAG: glutamate synthase subunit beta [Myxococcales bacterium]|nr:glutamate synthase subunit beta [Myxococcales bacterium]
MGRRDGFLVWPREPAATRPVGERLRDHREFVLPLADEHRAAQAGRCMDCGIPFCHQGCPLGNRIPDFNDRVYQGDLRGAWAILKQTNGFPEFTGRICPAPCEAACVLALDGAPVTIELIEKAIAEEAFAAGWEVPRPAPARTGRRVAVVGSGPAGLAAADQLNQAGHSVTVFEKADRAGGLLRYGIPDFKLEKGVIDRRLALLVAEGVEFRLGVAVGVDVPWADLRAGHDAVVLAIGAERPRLLDAPGAGQPGVVLAMPYLTAQNRRNAGDAVRDGVDARGQHVVILGGGDTGADCLGTALRQGAASVTQIEILPEPPATRPAGNPWPRWPLVRRRSSSHDEGGVQRFALRTRAVAGDERLEALELEPVALVDGQIVPTGGPTERLPADLLLLAVGFLGPELADLQQELGITAGPRGAIAVDARFATSVPGVFAAGDAVRGSSLVVHALSQGRECAHAVDAWLRGGASSLPTRGDDLGFD